MMLDLRHDNIRVSTIMPGSVQTNFGGRGTEDGEWKIDPAHIADTVVHLLKHAGTQPGQPGGDAPQPSAEEELVSRWRKLARLVSNC